MTLPGLRIADCRLKGLLTASVGLMLVLSAACVAPEPERRRPLEISFWCGSPQVSFDDEDRRQLRMIGAKEFFVKVGDLDLKDGTITLVEAKGAWSRFQGVEVSLVIGGTRPFVESFGKLSDDLLSGRIVDYMLNLIQRGREAGLNLRGIQFDLPVSNDALDKYAGLLGQIRKRVPAGLQVSLAARFSWEESASFRKLVQSVDFHVVRLFDDGIPHDLKELKTVSNPRLVGDYVRRFSRYMIPFHAGLTACGRCLVADRSGIVVASLQGLNPFSTSRNPGLKLDAAYPAGIVEQRMNAPTDYAGENFYVFSARGGVQFGDGQEMLAGHQLVFDVPTARGLRRQIEEVEGLKAEWFRGYVIYHYPEPGEHLALSLEQVASAVRGNSLEPRLAVRAARGRRGARVIEIIVENIGPQESFIAARAVEVSLRLEGIRMGRVVTKDFSHVEFFAASNGAEQPAAVEKANLIKLYAAGIGRGEVLTALIVTERAVEEARLFASYRVLDPDDFITVSSGEFPVKLEK